jgi:hypothetical protein
LDNNKKEEIQKRIRLILENPDYGGVTHIARKLNIKAAYVSNWKNRNLPSLYEAYKFCELINKSIGWLINGDEYNIKSNIIPVFEKQSGFSDPHIPDPYINAIYTMLKNKDESVKSMAKNLVHTLVESQPQKQSKGGTG